MGGEFEKTAKSQTSKTDHSGNVNNIRFHKSGNEIHFHNDDKKLKVAVPFAIWHRACQKFRETPSFNFYYVDEINKSIIIIQLNWENEQEVFKVIPLKKLSDTLKSFSDFVNKTVG